MSETDLKALQRRMDGALDVLKKEFGGLRTGRASAALLDPVHVDAYGSNVPLNQVAGVSVPEPRMIVVQVWDRGVVKAVDKALRESGLGLNPQTEGQTIRLPMPELTQDRRKELSKIAHKYAEAAKVSVRNVRRDGMDGLKKAEKNGDITEDEHRRFANEVQAKTDEHVKKIDEMLAHKEKEILTV
ncbi:MAG: ribosome recycling factor [Alphaproteobacteria bacterium]|nr:ribosome recycling factor [Alphaproteobacteria bacterium]